MMKARVLLFLLLAQAASAKIFHFGVKVGAPFTDAVDALSAGTVSTTRFTAGPTAELRIAAGFGFEVDALYKRARVDAGDSGTGTRTVNQWEFPLLAKYRLPGLGLRPYVEAGAAFRSVSDLREFVSGGDPSSRGFVIGGGLEVRIPKVRLLPEIRFTRWNSDSTGGAADAFRFNRNQAEFLLGILF